MRLKREIEYLCIAVILSSELYSFPITLSLSPPHSFRLEQRPHSPNQLSNGRSSSFKGFVFHNRFRIDRLDVKILRLGVNPPASTRVVTPPCARRGLL